MKSEAESVTIEAGDKGDIELKIEPEETALRHLAIEPVEVGSNIDDTAPDLESLVDIHGLKPGEEVTITVSRFEDDEDE